VDLTLLTGFGVVIDAGVGSGRELVNGALEAVDVHDGR
jgi:hypothetical protein